MREVGEISLYAAALAAMGSPGPATVGATATAAAFGLRPSLPYLFGSTTGTVAVLTAVAAGLGSVLAGDLMVGSVSLRPVLLVVCVGYLCWLSWRIASAPPPGRPTAESKPPSFLSGLLLGTTNPKAYAALTAVVAGHWPGHATLAHRVLLLVSLAVLALTIHLVWAGAGAVGAQALRRPGPARAINVTLGAVLAASSVPLLL